MRSLIIFVLITSIAEATFARGTVYFSSRQTQLAVAKFREFASLISAPSTAAAATECGYIFPGDASKFGCKGSGKAAADVAAACAGGGELACTGSGANRTCTCAFD